MILGFNVHIPWNHYSFPTLSSRFSTYSLSRKFSVTSMKPHFKDRVWMNYETNGDSLDVCLNHKCRFYQIMVRKHALVLSKDEQRALEHWVYKLLTTFLRTLYNSINLSNTTWSLPNTPSNILRCISCLRIIHNKYL